MISRHWAFKNNEVFLRNSPYGEGVSGDEERKQTKQTRFRLQPQKHQKRKTSSGKRGDTLPDGTKIEKATPLDLVQSDDDDHPLKKIIIKMKVFLI
ncbi:hypothetical protein RclHR1_00860018 [Rhizophagus clarus]|uniref:Uncharacterized protein n=1 Tax=Rhizophagus clarus TaxID=94130 RepID=A0A2Z6SFL7_9GLOM|nr:hypothetical protein RclHR1_00860018 [Rhizophagus clarus]